MFSLVWRATFIDVADEEQPQAPRGGRRPRAESEPCCKRRTAPGIFDQERSYVAGLSDRFCPNAVPPLCLAAQGAGDRVEASSATATVNVTGAEAKPNLCQEDCNVAVSSMLLRAKVEGTAGALADEATREPSSGASSLASGSPVSAPPQQGACNNTGSIGHPTLCSRPCLYFVIGVCANGAKCEFCHMEHAKRTPHLNRVHREQLRTMDASRAKALLIPLVREKALAFDGSARTASAVDRLASACGVVARVRRTREEQSLSNVLNGMTVRLLLIILERSVLQNEPEAQASAEALLVHLRGTVINASASL